MSSNLNIEIKEVFLQIFPDLNESDFDWKKKQNDYENWDSFSQLNLITMLEEKFSISISDMDSISIRSAEDALNFVKNRKWIQY